MTRIGPASSPASANRLRISVALCTYNGARFLQEQLDSIAAQQRPPDELVICDDGSEDASVSIAEAFARTVSFPIRIRRNSVNLGYSRNFAAAIASCSGEVIALADQDDLWYPQKLARLAELFLQHEGVGGVFSNGDLIDASSNRLPGDLWGSFSFGALDQQRVRSGDALAVLIQRNVVTGMAFAFRSCWRNTLAAMPQSWPHDAWLALMLAKENKLLACAEPLVAYRVHESQTIGVPITSAEKRRYVQAHGVQGYLDLSRKRNLKEYQQTAAQFDDLLAAYVGKASIEDERMLLQAKAKADHARNAARRLELGRLVRWPGVLGNRENYRRYSPTGTSAMIRDLFL